MNRKLILKLLLLLTVVTALSYFYIPNVFAIEGGSCYQGITAQIIKFCLFICTFLNLLSLYASYKSKKSTAKTFICISFMFWTIASFVIGSSHPSAGIQYFTILLLTILLLLILTFRQKNEENLIQ